MFNANFYQPNTTATREQAEKRLISLGYSNFSFKGMSIANGASFYFVGENGQEIRVSDHPLTGKRAFDTIQVSLYEIKVMQSPSALRNRYIAGEISKKEYKSECNRLGFIFKP